MYSVKTDWKNTQEALHGLEKLLTCTVCKKLVKEPRTLGGCEHFFCRTCTEKVVDDSCPVCNIPSHVKDIQPNRELKTAVSLCKQLARLLNAPDLVEMTDSVEENDSQEEIAETPASLGKVTKPNAAKRVPSESAVFDFADSPVDSPVKPVARRTRKAQAKVKIEQFIKKSNADWGIGQDKQEQCTSCKKPESDKIRQRVKFQRAAKSGVKPYVEDSERLSASESNTDKCEDTSDTENEIVKPTEKPKTKGRRGTATKVRNSAAKTEIEKNVKETGRKRRRKENSDLITSGRQSPTDVSVESISSGYASFSPVKSPNSDRSGKKMILSPTVRLARSVSPANSASKKNTKTVPKQATPTSTQRRGKIRTEVLPSTPLGGNSRSEVQSTPTSTPRTVKRTESPGRSPAFMKKNPKGETPLHIAVIKGDYKKAEELLEQGAPTNIKDNAGWTPLHEACNRGYVQIAELLLDHGALINIPGFENQTPLHDAILNDRVNMVRLLVSRGASVADRDVKGFTAMDLAESKSDEMKAALETPLANTQAVRTATEVPEELMSHQVVLLATGLNREQKRKVDQLALILHTKCLEEFSNEVTHLVAKTNDANMCARTMKYLKCVLTGKWIVNFEWVDHCVALKQRVTEEPFAVPTSSPNPDALGPELGRSNIYQQLPGLFDGCNFYTKGIWDEDGDFKNDITQLIQIGGGHLLTREPKLDTISESHTVPYHTSQDSKLVECSHYIVHHKKETRIGPKLSEVNAAWIIECCGNFRLIESA